MNQSSNAIRKEDVDFARIINCGYLAKSKGRMHQRLALAIGTRPVIGSSLCGSSEIKMIGFLETTSRVALGTEYGPDLTILVYRCYDMPTLYFAYLALLLNSITNCRKLNFHLYSFEVQDT